MTSAVFAAEKTLYGPSVVRILWNHGNSTPVKPMPPEKISLFYDQPRVNDTIPDEEEIKAAIQKMRYNKAPGTSEITAEHLRAWMQEAEDREQPRTDRWDKVVKIIQNAFTREVQPSRFNISILVCIPKDAPNEFRGIALLETLY